jgi:hypothetical protein
MELILHNFLLLLKRYRTSTLLSVAGLSVAFAVFFSIVARIYSDYSFDDTFAKAKNIYLCTVAYSGSSFMGTNTQTPKEFAEKYPEVLNFCITNPFAWQQQYLFEIEDAKGNTCEFWEKVIRVSEGFADRFLTGKVIMGDAKQAFVLDDSRAIIPESIAKKFFGKSRQWLNNRIKGNKVNGKSASFTADELNRFSSALLELSGELKNTALRIAR